MPELILKGRLKVLADKVPVCEVVADIGTDHAYLPIYLIRNNRCKKAIASDIESGPIKVAKKNIALYNLTDRIETRQGNGLETIAHGEAQCITISGIGGTLMVRLLEAGDSKLMSAQSVILQPLNDLDQVRKWLYENGFDIYDEQMVLEGQKFYCIICTRYTGMVKLPLDEFHLHVGAKLIEKKDVLLEKYCTLKVRQLNRVLLQLKAMDNNEELLSYHSWLLEQYLSLIEQIKEEKR